MVEAAQFAAGIRITLRQALEKPAVVVSGGILLAVVFLLTVGLALLQPYELTIEASQSLLYGIAVFEILLGLRVGLLRVSGRESDYALSMSGRFWRRSLPYLLPALAIPLPAAMLLTARTGDTTGLWLVFLGLATHYLQFFLAAVAVTVLFRRISRNLFARLALLFFGLIAVLATLSSNDFLFREVFLFEQHGAQAMFLSILAHIGVTAVAVVVIEALLLGLRSRPLLFGRYWPLLRLSFLHGYGQGSSSFFHGNRLLLRDSRLHRRLAALLLGVLAVLSTAAVATGINSAYQFQPLVWHGLLLVLAAAAAYNITQSIYHRLTWAANQRHAPVETAEIAVGSWCSGLVWFSSFMVIIAGLLAGLLLFDTAAYLTVGVAAFNQYILLFGWQRNLQEASHQTVTRIIVFLMAVTVGFVPLFLWNAAPLATILVIQLLWLLLTAVLLYTTKQSEKGLNG